MQKILSLLNDHPLVDHYTYQSPSTSAQLKLYEMVIYFVDKSELHVREIVTSPQRKYSYHWQDVSKNLIIRWDTAPHHQHLSTYPYHKHDPHPSPSKDITLEEVLHVIFSNLRPPLR